MRYEWRDNDGVMHVTAWSKAVRNAMLRGGAEYQRQRALNQAADNWNKIFMLSTDSGLQRIKQAAGTRFDAHYQAELYNLSLSTFPHISWALGSQRNLL
jgi:hypothetical protein